MSNTTESLPFKILSKTGSDSRFMTYQALRGDTREHILVKVPGSSFPSEATLARLAQEYELLQQLSHDHILQADRLQPYEQSQALVYKPFNGITLESWLEISGISISDFFDFAIALTETLAWLHQQNVVHKNISPVSILIRPEDKFIVLTGFGLAARISREPLTPNAHEINDTQLSYISPEQTGRMNRSLDQRSDLYSLGCLFYRLLCGKALFYSTDPLSVVHGHLALSPPRLEEQRINIPAALSNVVFKLLAKSAGDRYQSATGLLADLQECRSQWQASGQIAPFEPGKNDISEVFRIPDKLYGRENELGQLMEAYKQAAGGNTTLVLVSGYSGVGKSRLVGEIRKQLQIDRGYFVSGKFDQFKREIPLKPLTDAFRELIRNLLTEPEEQLLRWKEQILEATGSLGKILTDAIPELETLIGEQPGVTELPQVESDNRFHALLERFVNVFTRSGIPLCVFIDDLQWIDTSTRRWIEQQISTGKSEHFLLIGAYRDNEVNESHPLSLMADRLKKQNATIKEIVLQPLDKSTLNQMIADSLLCEPNQCADFSDQIYAKTNGNPFFTRQCLYTLHETGAIYFRNQPAGWNTNLEKLNEVGITDNVAELMIARIQKLSQELQNLVSTAACIGFGFNAEDLCDASGGERSVILHLLHELVDYGLILPVYKSGEDTSEEYRFLHDRVQQAAYSLLNDAEQKKLRLSIGWKQQSLLKSDEPDTNLYTVADHLNFARSLITDENQLMMLAEVNYRASVMASNAGAHETALVYVRAAMDCLPAAVFTQAGSFYSDLLLQRAGCEHMAGNTDEAATYYDQSIEQATDAIAKARVYQHKIYFYTNLRRFEDAYQAGRKAVGLLGVKLPSGFSPPHLIRELISFKWQTRGKSADDILQMKEMEDEKLRMAILLMATMGRAAYQIRPELCVVLCGRIVNLCLKHGNADGVFIGYMAFGSIFLGAILNRKQAGFDYGKLTLALVEKYKSYFYKAETHFVVGYFAVPWRLPATEMERYWLTAYESALETGDWFHLSCACCATLQSQFMRGVPYDDVLGQAERYTALLTRIGNEEGVQTLLAVTQAIRNLRGETEDLLSFSTANVNETEYTENLKQFTSRHFAHYYYINKMAVLYLRGAYEKAWDTALLSGKYLKDSPGMLHTAEHYFWKGMTGSALYMLGNKQGQKSMLQALKKFRNWSQGCESNFVHKSLLLEAEMHRAMGQNEQAQSSYEKAIDMAAKYGYTHILSLAQQRSAGFHHQNGRRRMAGFHLNDAVYNYIKLGAEPYARTLQEQFPDLQEYLVAFNSSDTGGAVVAAERVQDHQLDLATVFKSSEAISREIRLPDLMASMLRIIAQNAGAERVVLLLHRNGKLMVEGEYGVENDQITEIESTPAEHYEALPQQVLNLVNRTREAVVLDAASESGAFVTDPYFVSRNTYSVLCAPLMKQGEFTGVVYLENNKSRAAFTGERITLLNMLSGQIAISIENALLYENLEEKVKERTRELKEEKERSEALLLNILPSETAEELKRTGSSKARDFPMVTVLFTDFKNFTTLSENLSAQELVNEIDYCYSAFDNIVSKYGIEKIKTIGDSYMCAGGLPVPNPSNPIDTVRAALEIRDFVKKEREKREKEGRVFFDIRIGLHTGPVVAGIVGIKKFAYDIWGDTVNIASRMESSGEPGKINISGSTYERIKDFFRCEYRGKVHAKNKGEIDMYFVEEEIAHSSTL
ncbi:MAG: AAA family ATPase [Bacteroidetes bacterium]|nr:AAA family ATPase [Bacteroidota bacterium]